MTATEEFFLPEVVASSIGSVPASLYNRCCLLQRQTAESVFVPIRPLQFLAVLEPRQVTFVDSLNYAVKNGHGGRVIVIRWSFQVAGRDDLNAPVNCKINLYTQLASIAQQRLCVEFQKALELTDKRRRR